MMTTILKWELKKDDKLWMGGVDLQWSTDDKLFLHSEILIAPFECYTLCSLQVSFHKTETLLKFLARRNQNFNIFVCIVITKVSKA